jgi:hypothetical protein
MLKPSSELQFPPIGKPIKLANMRCIYCQKPFGKGERTKEHVIGRKFVPTGSFAGECNLIAWACSDCNGKKSSLESDLSAITMHPDIFGLPVVDTPAFHQEALRKAAGAISHRTRKAVLKSGETMSVSGELMPGVSVTFNMQSPPQADEERIFELAWYHVKAFFYYITFGVECPNVGHMWPGIYAPIAFVPRCDWGNVQMRSFYDLVSSWDYRVFGDMAAGFFRILIRRCPQLDPPLWGWALEWNQSYRVIGFLGDETAARAAHARLAPLPDVIMKTTEGIVQSRVNVPLSPADDSLFLPPQCLAERNE